MKVRIKNLTGQTINTAVEVTQTPVQIVQQLYTDDPSSATQLFSDPRAVSQFMAGEVDERSSFSLLLMDDSTMPLEWKTPLCNQAKAQLAEQEAAGLVPTFVTTIAGIVAGK